LSWIIPFILPSGHYWLRAAAADLVGNTSPLSDETMEVDINLPYRIDLPLVMRRWQ
jgi:hypothetical protein